MAEDSKKPVADQVEVDTTPRVTGIGGIFFKSADPGATKAWYSENLGMNVDDFGAPFEFRNANRPEEINYLNWDAFVDSTDYFDPSTKPFMINYRVHNLEGLVAKLKTNGVTILDELKVVEYGKFIHIQDNDGNKIELWEPVDSVLAGFGRKANK
ncbi:MAG: VOC family protein [Bacteroidota bacterium]